MRLFFSRMMTGHDSTLADWMRILLRRWRYLAAAVVLIVGLVLIRDLRSDNLYESTAEVFLIGQPERSSGGLTRPYVDPDRLLQSELRFAKSELVANAAAKALGTRPPPVSAIAIGRSNVFVISTRSTSAKGAQRATSAYLDSYVRLRRDQEQKAIVAAIAELKDSLDELNSQTDPTESRESEKLKIRDALVDLRVDLSISKDFLQTVSSPNLPSDPVSPRTLRNALLTFVPALLLGALAAFLRESLDESITSEDDIVKNIPQLTVIGQIPRIRRGEPARSVEKTPESPASEVYRRIRAQILRDSNTRVILVTSAVRGEGKTTTAANLAFSLAEVGKRVLLIDGDLRAPRLTKMFSQHGAGEGELDPIRIGEHLAFLAAPKSSLPKVGSGEWLHHVLDRLNASYEFILIDAPPLLVASESFIFADLVDGTLLVVGAGVATERQVRKVMRMRRDNAPFIGTVVNNVKRSEVDDYSRY